MNEKIKISILLTCAGGQMVPFLVDSLRKIERFVLTIIGVDAGFIGGNNFDFLYQIPYPSDEQYCATLLAIAMDHHVKIIIPGSDEEAKVLSDNREFFKEKNIVTACPDMFSKIFSDGKIEMYKQLEENGFPVPPSQYAFSKDDLIVKIDDMRKQYNSLVVKPSNGRGGRGVYILVNNEKEYNSDRHGVGRLNITTYDDFLANCIDHYSEHLPAIVSKWIEGDMFDMDILGLNGCCYNTSLRRRLVANEPNIAQEVLSDSLAEELGNSLIKKFNLNYLLDIDLMKDDKTHKLCIIEINPRPSGSSVFSVRGGVPLWENLIALCMGAPVCTTFKIIAGTYKNNTTGLDLA